MLATAALGGAVGSIASQGVAISMGMQDSFSWKGVAMSAIGAGAASGVGAIANAGMTAQQIATTPVAWSQAALRSAGASVATQGVGSMLGISGFSWKAVAASAAGAGASSALGSTGWMRGLNSVAAGTVRGLVSGGIQAGIFGTRPNWGSIATQSFGQALGDSFTQGKVLAEAQRVGNALGSEDMQPTDYSLASGGPVRFGTGSVESVSTPEELQAAFRQSERDYRSSTEQSVAGSGYVSQSGDSISRIVGTSAPQAIGNFMRANGLTGDHIEVGRNYFVPDDVMAYGDSTAAGQFALNQGNARIAAARAASLMAADGLRIGPTIDRAQAMGIYSGNAAVPFTVPSAGGSPGAYVSAWDGRSEILSATANTIDSIAANPLGAAGYLLGKALGGSERDAAALAALGAVGGDLLALRSGGGSAATARRVYLNEKFSRTGDLNLDINIRGRQEVASNFFASQGVPEGKIASYMTGIDLTRPVEIQVLGPGKALWQYQAPGAPQGNWYSLSPSVQPTELGISPFGYNRTTSSVALKVLNSYVTAGPTQVLRSTSASVVDAWSVSGQRYSTVGGAQQLFSGQQSLFRSGQ